MSRLERNYAMQEQNKFPSGKEVTIIDGTFEGTTARKISVLENGNETSSLVMAFFSPQKDYLEGDMVKICDDYVTLHLFKNKKEVLSCSVELGLYGREPNSLDGMMDVYAKLSKDIQEGFFNRKKKVVKAFLDEYIFNTPEIKEVLMEHIENKSFKSYEDYRSPKKNKTEERNQRYIKKISKKIAKEKMKNIPKLYTDEAGLSFRIQWDQQDRKSAFETRAEENKKLNIIKRGFIER